MSDDNTPARIEELNRRAEALTKRVQTLQETLRSPTKPEQKSP